MANTVVHEYALDMSVAQNHVHSTWVPEDLGNKNKILSKVWLVTTTSTLTPNWFSEEMNSAQSTPYVEKDRVLLIYTHYYITGYWFTIFFCNSNSKVLSVCVAECRDECLPGGIFISAQPWGYKADFA